MRRQASGRCALCRACEASRKGEDVWPRWLIRHLFPVSNAPYLTERNGAVLHRQNHFAPRLLPVCDEHSGDGCNQILGRRFEQEPTQRALRALFDGGSLDATSARAAGLWWVKTTLLATHPASRSTDHVVRPTWEEPLDHTLYDWMITGQPPPSDISLWLARRGEDEPIERTDTPQQQVQLPQYSIDGANLVSRVAQVGIAGVQAHLVVHPGWSVVHPFEESGKAVRVHPWAGGELVVGGMPALDAVDLRDWFDLWGTKVRLHLESGFDPRSSSWRLGTNWATEAILLPGVNGMSWLGG